MAIRRTTGDLSLRAQARYLRCVSLRYSEGSASTQPPIASITMARISSDTSLREQRVRRKGGKSVREQAVWASARVDVEREDRETDSQEAPLVWHACHTDTCIRDNSHLNLWLNTKIPLLNHKPWTASNHQQNPNPT